MSRVNFAENFRLMYVLHRTTGMTMMMTTTTLNSYSFPHLPPLLRHDFNTHLQCQAIVLIIISHQLCYATLLLYLFLYSC
jgi:hypothetical protein